MKKLLLSTTALLGLTAVAAAADLPYRKAPAPYVAVPVFTWTGFYVGVNAGYGFSDNNGFRNIGFPAGSITNSAGTNGVVTLNNNFGGDRDGFVGGGQVGYNYQIGGIVIGLEADAQYADLNRGRGTVVPSLGYAFTGATGIAFANPQADLVFRRRRDEFFGTVRGRVGYAWDRLLVYGTGGLAYNADDIGWTAGGGVEYAFTPNITAKVEGLYVSLDRGGTVGQSVFTPGTLVTPGAGAVFVGNNARNNTFDFAVVRAGLNYKFSWY